MTTNDTNNMLKNQENFNTSDEYVKSDDTNLTEKWKAGELKSGWYYIKTKHGFIQPMYYLITRVNGKLVKGFAEEPEDRVVEVLAPCGYDHFVDLTEKAKKYDRIKINGNYPDKISKLKSRIKHLLELQANQDKEVENLRELLKECRPALSHLGKWNAQRQNLLTRINAAIGESEE